MAFITSCKLKYFRYSQLFFALYNEEGKDVNLFESIVKRKRLKNLNKESIATLESLNRC